MSVLTKNKSTLYAKNTYRYQFKEFLKNENKETIVVLTDIFTNDKLEINLNKLRSDERTLNQIEPTSAFDLGWQAGSDTLNYQI